MGFPIYRKKTPYNLLTLKKMERSKTFTVEVSVKNKGHTHKKKLILYVRKWYVEKSIKLENPNLLIGRS